MSWCQCQVAVNSKHSSSKHRFPCYLLGLFYSPANSIKNLFTIIYKDMAVWQEWFSKNLCADFENLIATKESDYNLVAALGAIQV